MAIFTALATFLLAGTFLAGSAIATGALALGLGLATTIGVSYVMKALAGTPSEPAKQDNFGTQGNLAAGGDIPRSFGLGTHATAGSLVYANYWGHTGLTPNAYLTQVIAVSDLPREALVELWISGEKVSLTGAVDPNMGTAVAEYSKGGADHLWIKYYNGTQTAADPFLVGTVASTDRPYGNDRIGTGVCYCVCTSLVDDTLFKGFPTFKFVLSGIPLYDPSKDSTNGGSGSHRYSDPATWGGDGDQLPAVQAYNILRGIRYNGAWLYGLQNMTGAARLPAANWNAQIAKCRATVTGISGPEPAYRSGGQVTINTQPANAIEAVLTACQGRLSEIGGFYKIHLGAPDSPAFSWTDADLLSSEQQTFRPFFSLADSVNGIQGTYPDPAQGWETATAPALYRTDLEVRDGNRRLMAGPAFDFVPYPEQVQRLQKSGIEESQRARTHVLPLPPAYWVVEPGDVGTWSSVRNGYTDKLFRVDHVVDRANLDMVLSVTEVDPTDYDWNHATDYTGVSTGATIIPRPQPQGVIDWYAEGTVLYDADGLGRHAAIRIAWDGTLPGVVGVQYEVRLTADLSSVTRGRTDQLAAGALIISQGIIEQTAYQVRGQYLPSSPRDMLWSDWLDVVTPSLPAADIPQWIAVQVTSVMDYLNDRVEEIHQRLSTVTGTSNQRNWLDLKDVRSQLSSRSDAAFAEISRVETVATSGDSALASDIETLTATVGDNTANITINATAIASNSSDIDTLNGYAAAQYSVTLDVNNYATGFELINGGPGTSATTFTTDKFLIAAPGVSGGAPVPMFAVANVNGSPKVAIRGDLYADGTIAGVSMIADTVTAREIAASTITAAEIAANTITADRLVTGTITSDSGKIGALSVKSLSLGDASVVVPVAETRSDSIGSTAGAFTAVSSVNLSIDTTGLSGKSITIIAGWTGQLGYSGSGANPAAQLVIDGAVVQGVQATNSQDGFFALTGSRAFTAGGGVENHTVVTQYASGPTGGPVLLARTLWAMAGKR
jgi:Putative phage tail protein